MKLNQELFNHLIASLRDAGEAVYDTNARLFLGSDGTQYPSFSEPQGSYILYATIAGKTLPLEHGMNTSMFDESRATEPPEGCPLPCAYYTGIASHFDKPLEVLAFETQANPNIRPKWDIWMLRDIGEPQGYLNDIVARALANK